MLACSQLWAAAFAPSCSVAGQHPVGMSSWGAGAGLAESPATRCASVALLGALSCRCPSVWPIQASGLRRIVAATAQSGAVARKGVLPRASVRIVVRQRSDDTSSQRARPTCSAVPGPERVARDLPSRAVDRESECGRALSYAGQFNVTISDPAFCTDVEVFAWGVSDSKWWKLFAELPSLCGVGVRHDHRHLTIGKAFVHPAGCVLGDAAIWHRWGLKPLIRVRLSSWAGAPSSARERIRAAC